MEFPIRCFTCGAVLAHLYEEYVEEVEKNGKDKGVVLDNLGVERHCCRRMFISHVDTVDQILQYSRK